MNTSKNPKKRYCQAVIDVQFRGSVDTITVCGLAPCDKPKLLYIPLCAGHGAIAEVDPIDVFTDKMIAEYRI